MANAHLQPPRMRLVVPPGMLTASASYTIADSKEPGPERTHDACNHHSPSVKYDNCRVMNLTTFTKFFAPLQLLVKPVRSAFDGLRHHKTHVVLLIIVVLRCCCAIFRFMRRSIAVFF